MEQKATTWEIALLRLGMPFSRYLLYFSLPASVLGLLAGLAVWWSVSDAVGAVGSVFLILVFPLVTFTATILYPVTQVSAEAIQIEQDMHMFMTRMGILSLGESAEKGMFDVLKEMGDYGALAKEIQSIETLSLIHI